MNERSAPAIVTPLNLDAAGTINGASVLAGLLIAGIILSFVTLAVAPWQQSVRGTGRLIAYAPLERQQQIEAPIAGRVTTWFVQEGDHVDAGDPIVELSDNDPEILGRLERERDSIQAQLDAATLSIGIAEAKITSLEAVREAAVLGAGLKRQIAVDRKDAAERALDAAKASAKTAKLNVSRQEALHNKGLVSTRTLELAQLKVQTAQAGLERARASLKAARRQVKAMGAERTEKDADTNAKTQDGRSSLQKSMADKAKAEGALAKIEVRLAQQRTMRIVAPRAGVIFRLVAKEGGEVAKKGDALAILVPDTLSRAVELWVDGNDAPLITAGRHVRVQFEGWPAVQFVGWPSAAVGTFGGTVDFVDATDNGRGEFRIVIVPDDDEPWPESRYLRQGVRANGWVLLNQVSIGYELWRQFNGFPPAVTPPSDALAAEGDAAKGMGK